MTANRQPSVESRNAPPISWPWLHTWTLPLTASTPSSARHFEPMLPAPSELQRPAVATSYTILLCWVSVTSWARETAPRMDPHPLPTRKWPMTLVTITATWEPENTGAGSTALPVTSFVACLEILTLELSRITFKHAKWRGPGHSLIITIFQFKWLTCLWSLDPVLLLQIRQVYFLFSSFYP